jgi:hypothetical protein
MVIKKRCLLWDWTNTDGPGHKGVPHQMDKVNFDGPMHSVSNVSHRQPPHQGAFHELIQG